MRDGSGKGQHSEWHHLPRMRARRSDFSQPRTLVTRSSSKKTPLYARCLASTSRGCAVRGMSARERRNTFGLKNNVNRKDTQR
jgi:hypothetical protein